MPWYKTGTVSVALNSNAVTGTGTAFIVNCRVGDAFRGPDGRWYEVTNVASNTAISIDPPYIGATASGGSYALAPMQGYVKDSADALRAIVNAYGVQLAALKTTGNYDILPVSKGGTGGATQSAAQDGLGLVPVTSTTDVTAGKLLTPGWMGLGNQIVQPALSTFLQNLPTGIYRAVGNTTAGSPYGAAVGCKVIAKRYSATDTFYTVYFSTVGKLFEGWYNGSSIVWQEILTNNNIVGTVSQVGGVATGAIIERGNNVNGDFTRYADGTLECWRKTADIAHTAGSEVITVWTLPSETVSISSAIALASVSSVNSTQAYNTEKLSVAVSNSTAVQLRSKLSVSQNYSFNLYFKGRWF